MNFEKYVDIARNAIAHIWNRASSYRLFRFGIVGIAATVSYFLLGLFFVNLLSLPALIGNALAYAISFAVSYLGQCLWTFEATGSHLKMLPKFALTQGIGLLINSCIIAVCMRLGLKYEFSMLIAIALVPVFVYLICKYWVFAKKAA